LLQNVKGKNCFQIALGEIESEVEFFYSPANADSSLIEPREFIAKYPVKVARIDTLFEDFIKLLKIDAEGAEIEVLRGAQNILHKIKYISVDLGFERGRTEESTFIEVMNFLIPNGFLPIKVNKRLVVLFENTSMNHFG